MPLPPGARAPPCGPCDEIEKPNGKGPEIMTENTTTETAAAEATTDAPVTDIAAARAKSPRERARAASADKQAAASAANPKAGKVTPSSADVIGAEPHTARLRERFEALSATKRKAAVKAARTALEGGATKAGAWNTAMDEIAPPGREGPGAAEGREGRAAVPGQGGQGVHAAVAPWGL